MGTVRHGCVDETRSSRGVLLASTKTRRGVERHLAPNRGAAARLIQHGPRYENDDPI
jgi:hypothetical protein